MIPRSVYSIDQNQVDSGALVMELVEGPTLADRIAQGPIPIDEALPIAKQICDALDSALRETAMTFAPDGKLWVVEMRGYMPDVDGTGELAGISGTVSSSSTHGPSRPRDSTSPREVVVRRFGVPRPLEEERTLGLAVPCHDDSISRPGSEQRPREARIQNWIRRMP